MTATCGLFMAVVFAGPLPLAFAEQPLKHRWFYLMTNLLCQLCQLRKLEPGMLWGVCCMEQQSRRKIIH